MLEGSGNILPNYGPANTTLHIYCTISKELFVFLSLNEKLWASRPLCETSNPDLRKMLREARNRRRVTHLTLEQVLHTNIFSLFAASSHAPSSLFHERPPSHTPSPTTSTFLTPVMHTIHEVKSATTLVAVQSTDMVHQYLVRYIRPSKKRYHAPCCVTCSRSMIRHIVDRDDQIQSSTVFKLVLHEKYTCCVFLTWCWFGDRCTMVFHMLRMNRIFTSLV